MMSHKCKFQNLIKVILLLALLVPSLGLADIIVGEVFSVADGDTITVISEGVKHKIRLVGIDAPEKKQAYGEESKQSLHDLVYEQMVSIVYNKHDRYKRILGKVIFGGKDINLEQIRRGLAWHYKRYQKEQEYEDRSLYAQEEYLAQKDRVGLWSDNNPTPPWDFRKRFHINH